MRPGEIWTDDYINWEEGEEHIGDVILIEVGEEFVTFNRLDGPCPELDQMNRYDFVNYFSKKELDLNN